MRALPMTNVIVQKMKSNPANPANFLSDECFFVVDRTAAVAGIGYVGRSSVAVFMVPPRSWTYVVSTVYLRRKFVNQAEEGSRDGDDQARDGGPDPAQR